MQGRPTERLPRKELRAGNCELGERLTAGNCELGERLTAGYAFEPALQLDLECHASNP
jgi:hypothetical protein